MTLPIYAGHTGFSDSLAKLDLWVLNDDVYRPGPTTRVANQKRKAKARAARKARKVRNSHR